MRFTLRVGERTEAFGDLTLLVELDHGLGDAVGRWVDVGGAVA